MSDSTSDIVEQFKDLSDLEFEILFIDDICKKLKSVDNAEIRSESLLIVYLNVIETLKKFRFLAKEGGRTIPHEDAINMTIDKSEAFLTKVADDETQAMYVSRSLSTAYSFIKELLWQLKKELTETPKYAHLKRE